MGEAGWVRSLLNAPSLVNDFITHIYNQRMPDYHRFYEGGAYFFTVVTFNRLPILTSDAARRILRSAWLDVSKRMPFKTVAVCLLPEHKVV